MRLTKQTQDIIFSRKTKKTIHPWTFFSVLGKVFSKKHLEIHLDSKLFRDIHIKIVLTDMSKALALLQKCEIELPRPPLINIYKVFIKSHVYCGTIFFDQIFHNSLHQRLEPTQYNAVIPITRATRKTSNKKYISTVSRV